MTWSKDSLRRLTSERGEDVSEPILELALLAHERMCGRTEETYAPDVAKRELQSAINRMTERPPVPSVESYMGLKQLQKQSFDKIPTREVEKSKAPEPGATPLATIVRAYTKDKERER